jgi:hypothetical protein
VADRFARLPLYLTDLHGSQRVERVQEAMSHAVYVHDISHVIVDNMQFMLGTSTSGGGYAGMDRFTLQDSVVQIFRLVGIISGTLYCRVADPGSGMRKKIWIRIRVEHPRYFFCFCFHVKEQLFGLKILKFFDADPESGIFLIRVKKSDPG